VSAEGWDPLTGGRVIANGDSAHVYSRLLRYKTGTRENLPSGEVEGDAATSWEVSGDGLQVTFKLRPNMKFDARPPTSGRALNADDVKFSWDRFTALSAYTTDLDNSQNPGAPVASLTTPDAETVVLKLAFPYAPIFKMAGFTPYFSIMPTEADGQFDPKNDARGSGPWLLDSWAASTGVEYRRNPDFYGDQPFLDGMSNVFLTEYSAGLAQFERGNFWTFEVTPEDILPVKQRNPELLLQQDATFPPAHGYSLTFGAQPESPFGFFHDQRMRQAVSMLVDRDGMIEFNYSPSIFERNGFPVTIAYNSHIGAANTGWWVDPQGPDIGPGGKWFTHNVEEAKKLIDAAGMTGEEVTLFQTNQTPARAQLGSVFTEMLKTGLNVSLQLVEQTDAVSRYWGDKTGWEGLTIQASTFGPDIDTHFASKYTVGGRSSYVSERMPGISDLIDEQRREFDLDKRISLVKEIQRQLADYMPSVPYDGATLAFTLQQPWLMNVGAIIDSGVAYAIAYDTYPRYWYDKSKT
jgi:ABC-type transport system substrate-binding protein